jgi:soluble lytic murein transglycosylase-like protein
MSLNIVPALAIVLIIFFSSPNNSGTKDSTPSQEIAKSQNNISTEKKHNVKVDDSDPDYKTIYKYITSIYKKIKEEDAKLIAHYLVKMGKEHDIDPKLAAAVIARESAFDRKAISSTGAKGLGQIKNFNFKSLNIEDPFDIKENINGTVKYLKEMGTRWKSSSDKTPLALASYYKGYTAVKNKNGKFDTATKKYVKDILSYYKNLNSMRNKLESTF